MITDALTYPYREDGKYILMFGTISFLIVQPLAFFPILGLIVMFFVTGYFIALFFSVVETTADGKDSSPGWPDFTNFSEDIAQPILYMLSALFFSFLPLGIVLLFNFPAVAKFTLLILGLYHFPMAVLSVSLFQTAMSACPIYTVPAIMRSFISYTSFVIIMGLMLTAQGYLQRLSKFIPIAGYVLNAFVGMYFMLALGRLLGLLYRRKPDMFGKDT